MNFKNTGKEFISVKVICIGKAKGQRKEQKQDICLIKKMPLAEAEALSIEHLENLRRIAFSELRGYQADSIVYQSTNFDERVSGPCIIQEYAPFDDCARFKL